MQPREHLKLANQTERKHEAKLRRDGAFSRNAINALILVAEAAIIVGAIVYNKESIIVPAVCIGILGALANSATAARDLLESWSRAGEIRREMRGRSSRLKRIPPDHRPIAVRRRPRRRYT